MATWLLKTEPETFAWDDLVKEGTTPWTGVANAQAQANLRAMKPGDRAVVYHSGERRAVGIAEVVRAAYPDPGAGDGGVCVDVRAVEPLPAPVPLEAIKQEPAFEGSVLLRQGRLSVVPLSPAEWRDLEALALVIARTGGLRRKNRF
jgi:predicted RNA-binding protein with PUA-like domain